MKKIITIIGARPQIIKSSAISRAIRNHYSNQLEEIIVHTGQHYDENMSKVFFEEMEIPQPKYNLQVGSGNHGEQTAKMIEGIEKIILAENPDALLVYGDTNSTVAGALAASKLHVPVVHVEAGLRSFQKRMPEEINRIMCDHVSTLLFTPTEIGLKNLEKEGFSLLPAEHSTIDHPQVFHCGDVMYDNSLYFSSVSDEKATVLQNQDWKSNYALITIHRDHNTDQKENLNAIFKAFSQLLDETDLHFVFPVHPRTKKKMAELLNQVTLEQIQQHARFHFIEPVGFLDMIALEKNAKIVLTDSGGVQKESYFFQKPCVIFREETEWLEIVENGNATLVGAHFDRIISETKRLLSKTDYTHPNFYGDGKAAEFICTCILGKM